MSFTLGFETSCDPETILDPDDWNADREKFESLHLKLGGLDF